MRVGLLVLGALLSAPGGRTAMADPLPKRLTPADTVRLARERRAEIVAARARAAAAAERPRIVSALPDPMLMATVDHLPLSFMGADGNLGLQQEFPLSRVLGWRARAATAEAERFAADADRVTLDVELEALGAYYMLAERRRTARILDDQLEILRQLADVARSHYAAAHGTEAEVLRLDNELARLAARCQALPAEIRSAEAMLDTALALPPDLAVPELAWPPDVGEPPDAAAVQDRARASRPELRAMRAEETRAAVEIEVMRSMYAPMGLVRAGPAYTMDDGPGLMVMFGITLPVWRGKLRAGVREALAMREMARADRLAMDRMVTGEAVAAREAVLAERAQLLGLRDEVLPRAREVVVAAAASYAAAKSDAVTVLDAARAYRETQMEELMAEIRLGVAHARLARAIGTIAGGAP